MDKILLGHGSGGKLSRELISDLFVKHFSNPILDNQTDSAILSIENSKIAFTGDSFVVDPLMFPGGNIGKIAVCGTVNDLAVSGATPLYLNVGFIIEEGLEFSVLEEIVKTMSLEARKAGVLIVTGDTKVVDKGKCDKVFIHTSGVGRLDDKHEAISYGENILPGDKILINGSVADHGMAVMAAREFQSFDADIKSDCASLNLMIKDIIDAGCEVKFMRDATRGGLSTVICELAESSNTGIDLFEENIPVRESVRGMCEILGFDPLYVANEGKVILVVADKDAEKAVEIMKKHEEGKEATIIGAVVEEHSGKAWLNTEIGGKRIIDMLAGEQLPRIC